MNAAPAQLLDLEGIAGNIISTALALVAMVSIVMIVVGGFQLISAGADKEAAGRARGTITFAILGVILGVSAWLIINLFGSFIGIPDIGIVNFCFNGKC